MSAQNEKELDAGREMDALIAEKVMGWTRYPKEMHPTDNRTINGVLYCPPDFPHDGNSANVVPYYSTDIKAAWEVVEKVVSRNQDTILSVTRNSLDGKLMGEEANYFCTIEDISDGIEEWEASAETAPLAICRAALARAKGENQ